MPTRRTVHRLLSFLLIYSLLIPQTGMTAQAGPRTAASDLPGFGKPGRSSLTGLFFADLDGDRDVDGADLGIAALAWNCATGAPCFDASLDFNANGVIDAFDLARIGNEFDISPPALAVTSPAEGATLSGQSVQVSGTVSDLHGATVTVNGVAAAVSGQNWQATVPLAPGNLALHVAAVDGVGLTSVASRLVAVDQAGPFIDIRAPRHRQSVYTDRPVVEISYRDFDSPVNPASLQVTVQESSGGSPLNVTGNLAADASGATGRLAAPLAADRAYSLTVSLRDSLGNLSTVSTSFYIPPDPTAITPPVETDEAGWVSGVIYDTATCDAHLINCQGVAGVTVTLDAVDQTALALARESRARSLEGQSRFSARLTDREEALVRAAFTPITGTVVTGPDGFFAFPVAASGRYALRAEKAGFTYGQRLADIVRERSTPTNDIFLTPLDSAKTLCDSGGCFHASADGQMELEIPPGAIRVGETVDVTATEFDRVYFLPSGELPPGTWETYAFNLGGDSDYQFETPVSVRLKNSKGFAPGTQIPLGFWNQTLLQWEHEGTATVSGDGVWVEMQLDHFSNHDPNFPVTPGSATPASQDKTKKDDDCAEGQKGNSEVILRSGFLRQEFSLPGVEVLGRQQRLAFKYSSGRADFTEIIEAALALESTGGLEIDGFVQAELFIEGQSTANFTFRAEDLADGGEVGQFRFLWDGRDSQGNRLPPGVYRFGLRVRIPYTAQFFAAQGGRFGAPPDLSRPIGRSTRATFEDFIFGSVLVNGEVDGPFGAGWVLDGQQRLYRDESGRILIDDGCNVDEFYFPAQNLTLPPAGTPRAADEPMRGIFQEEEIEEEKNDSTAKRSFHRGVAEGAEFRGEIQERTSASLRVPRDSAVGREAFHSELKHRTWIGRIGADQREKIRADQPNPRYPRSIKPPGLGKFLLRPVGENIGGTVITNTVLSLANSPYILTGDLVIAAGVAVTVEAGVVITGSLGEEIRVLGYLEAIGTADAPIRFSAVNASRWDGILFDGGTGRLRHVQVGVTNVSNSANLPAAVAARNVLTGEVRIEQSRIHNSNAGGIRAVNSRVVLDGVEIDRNGFNTGFGLQADGDSALFVRNSNFHDNFRTPLNIRPQHLTGFTGNSFADNSPNRAEIGGGSFASPVVLSNFGLDEIRPSGDWTVPAGITLTLTAGTILNSNPGVEIRVQGHLAALGEGGNRVHFRGAGGWDGLIFDGGTGLLRQIALNNSVANGIQALNVQAGEVRIEESRLHSNRGRALDVVNSRVVIEDSEFDNNNFATGSEGIRVDGASHFFLSGSSFHDNKRTPLSLPAQHLPNLRDNNFADNLNGTVDVNRIEIRGGVLLTSTVLASVVVPEYRLLNSMTVTRGVTLTIQAGVLLRGNADTELTVLGHLRTEGTEESSVRLGVAQPKQWKGVVFDGGSGLLQQTRIEGGGGDVFNNSLGKSTAITAQDVESLRIVGGTIAHAGGFGLHAIRSRVTLEGVDIHNSTSGGVVAEESVLEIVGGRIRNSPVGLTVQGSARGVVVHLADIQENQTGVRNDGSGDVDARFNFWGHPSGPLHPTLNPGGQGNRVSDGVIFQPLLESQGADAGIQRQTATDFSSLTFDQATGTFTRHYLDGTTVHFDAAGRHDFTQDPEGNRTAYRYNPDGTVAGVEMAAAGRAGADWRWGFSYQSTESSEQLSVNSNQLSVGGARAALMTAHRLLITDPAGRVTTLTVDERGDLIAVARPGYGATRRFAYDAAHRMTHKTDEGGFTTAYVYGSHGRLVALTLPPRPVFNPATGAVEVIAETRTFTPSDVSYQLVNGLPPGTPDAPGEALVASAALRDEVALGRGSYSTLSNEWGSPLGQTDAIGRESRYERNGANLITKERSPEGDCTEYRYDEQGNVLERVHVDKAGCGLASGQRAAGQERRWTYTYEARFNRVKTETDPNGNVTTYTYDYEEGLGSAGRLIRIVKAAVDDGSGATVNPTIRYTYNAAGQKLTSQDARGSLTRYVYTTGDPGEAGTIFADGVTPVPGLLTRIIRDEGGLGVTTVYRQFDAAGNPLETVDPNGGVHRSSFDGANRLLTTTDPLGRVTQFEYDAKGNLARRVDDFSADGSGRNVATVYSYDPFDRLLSQRTDADGISRQSSNAFDINGNLAAVTDSNGFTTLNQYDDANQLIAIVDPVGNRMEYCYNGRGELAEVVEADGVLSRLVYDDFGRVVQEVKDAGGLNLSVASEYDAWGNLTRYTDPVGTVTCYEYDALNRMRRRVRDCTGLALPTTFRYNLNGDPVEEIDERGFTRRTDYDALGRATGRRLSGAGISQSFSYSYDALGNLTRMVDERGTITERNFNPRNLLVEERRDVAGLNLTTGYAYDRLDNPQTVTDPEGIVTFTEYNAFGKLTRQVHDFAGGRPGARHAEGRYQYDNNLNLIAMTDPNGNTTRYEYDSRNSQTRIGYADGTSIRYNYTVDRLPASRTDQAGDRVEMSYDGANRLVARRYPGGASQTFAYDAADRRTLAEQVMNGHNTRWQWTYNALGDVTSSQQTVDGLAHTTGYAYDYPANQRTTTYPSGAVVVHRRDGLERAVQVSLNGGQIAGYTHNDAAGTTALAHSNGVTSQTARDSLGRIASVKTTGPGGVLADYRYGYNGVDLRTFAQRGHESGAPADVFSYDGLYQIADVRYGANATAPGSVTSQRSRQRFALDNTGNRLALVTDGATESYQPSSPGQLSDPMNRYGQVGSAALAYDAKGNLTNDGNRVYSYDFENRQIGVSGPGGAAEYVFDALGNRVARIVNGQRTLFVYDDQRQVIEERDNGNGLALRVVYGGEMDEPLLIERGGAVHRLHRDAQGNISEATNAAGQPAEGYRYDAFGRPHIFDGSGAALAASAIGNPYLYTARRLDPESGTYHFRARSYSPSLGRFLQMDPKGYVDGANLYANYFDVNARDPLGTDVWVTNTPGAEGMHRRVCVDVWRKDCTEIDGEFCIGLYPLNGDMTTLLFSFQDAVVKDDTNEEFLHANLGILNRQVETDCCESQVIEKYFRQHLGRRVSYNLLAYNCRDFAGSMLAKAEHYANGWVTADKLLNNDAYQEGREPEKKEEPKVTPRRNQRQPANLPDAQNSGEANSCPAPPEAQQPVGGGR